MGMKKFIVERNFPGAGNLSAEELKSIAQTSNKGIDEVGNSYQWIESYVTGDKIYCVYIAPNEEMVREHAQKGGFPANAVNEVRNVIDPTTAE